MSGGSRARLAMVESYDVGTSIARYLRIPKQSVRSEFLDANKQRVIEGQNEPGGSGPYRASDELKDTYTANPGRSINLKESKFLPFFEP